MINIPHSFEKADANYITIPCIQRFAKKYGLDTVGAREDLMTSIKKFSHLNLKNQEIVESWLEIVLKEGIKDLYIAELEISTEIELLLKNDKMIEQLLALKLNNNQHTKICTAKHVNNFNLLSFQIFNGINGKTISCTFTRLITLANKKGNETLVYPVFVDILVDKSIIIGRAKPKSDLYYEDISSLDVSKTSPVSTERIVKDVLDIMYNILNIKRTNKKFSSYNFRNRLYKVLDKYTFTPKLIKDKIDIKQVFIDDLVSSIMTEFSIPHSSTKDLKSDINNMAEKYISINWPDKNIFTIDREAYPLKLKATDEEDSRVEQTSTLEEPLQSKSVFFDNKKMLQNAQSCDGVRFVFKRKDKTYFGESFKVEFKNDKGFCIIKFLEFTEECDIQNVLSNIINS